MGVFAFICLIEISKLEKVSCFVVDPRGGGGGREFPEGIERITVNRTMICQLEEKGGAWSDDIPLHCN